MARRVPFATLVIALAVLAAFAVELRGDGIALCQAFGLVPARPAPLALLSYPFLHDPGTAWHVAGNVVALALFGSVVERELGALRFVALYVAAGIAGGLLHVVVDPSSTMPLVGASGAVFGVIAVAGVVRPRLLGFAMAFGGVEVWHAFTGGAGDVAFGCHIGGFASGVALAAFARLRGAVVVEPA